MLRNYLITAIRNLIRNRSYTLINVFGLALGISAALVLFKVVLFEKSFDTFYNNYDDLYRFVRHNVRANTEEREPGIPNPFSAAFKNDFPDFGKVTRTLYQGDGQLAVKDRVDNISRFQIENGIAFVDPEFFELFEQKWLAGNAETALRQPKTVVITARMAFQLFGLDGNHVNEAIGRSVELDGELNLDIVGVIADIPDNTVLPFDIMIEYEALDGYYDFYSKDSWGSISSNANVYLLKPENVSIDQIEAQLPDFKDKYETEEGQISYFLQPMNDVHFNEDYDNYNDRTTSRQMLIGPTLVALFLILTACVNFINLATAMAVKRSKEVGIRKVLGGRKEQLVSQFLMETFLVTLISVLMSLGIAELALNNFNDLIGYDLSLSVLQDTQILTIVFAVIITVTFLAGGYPAFILSSLKPTRALKNKSINAVSGKFNLRRGLVIFQFFLSQVLVIATLVVISQMSYFENKDMGFRKESVITFPLPTNEPTKLSQMRNMLLSNSRVEKVSFAFGSPMANSNMSGSFNYAPLSSEQPFDVQFKCIDEHYLDLYDIELLAGRAINKSDTLLTTAVITETVMRIMEFDNPEDAIGKRIATSAAGDKTIVGVVKDFHSQSLHFDVAPVIFINLPRFYYQSAVRYVGSDDELNQMISQVEAAWNTSFPDYIFDYDIYAENVAENYNNESRMMRLFQIFSGIAILIGCLGLYGLVAFMANQKNKEIGVRKVLGASVNQILAIFSKELILLIVIAFLVAAPVSYYLMKEWLQGFSYAVAIEFWVFLIAIGFTLVVGGVTTGYRSLRAATANPVNSLRSE